MPSFKFIWPPVHDFSWTNPKNTPSIRLFWQTNIFGTKFGSFCIIQKRFGHNWIKDGHAVRFYFWALFANLNFLNFIACAIVQWYQSSDTQCCSRAFIHRGPTTLLPIAPLNMFLLDLCLPSLFPRGRGLCLRENIWSGDFILLDLSHPDLFRRGSGVSGDVGGGPISPGMWEGDLFRRGCGRGTYFAGDYNT